MTNTRHASGGPQWTAQVVPVCRSGRTGSVRFFAVDRTLRTPRCYRSPRTGSCTYRTRKPAHDAIERELCAFDAINRNARNRSPPATNSNYSALCHVQVCPTPTDDRRNHRTVHATAAADADRRYNTQPSGTTIVSELSEARSNAVTASVPGAVWRDTAHVTADTGVTVHIQSRSPIRGGVCADAYVLASGGADTVTFDSSVSSV